jgi:hypothetical protein
MSPRLKLDLPHATPAMAKRVWQGLRGQPSSRKVSKKLLQAGFFAHHTTIARWRRRGWPATGKGQHSIDAALAGVDIAAPLLTGDPKTTVDELVNLSEAKAQLERLSEKELLTAAARQALITITLVEEQFNAQLPKLVNEKLAETAVLVGALAALIAATTDALRQQALAPNLPKG